MIKKTKAIRPVKAWIITGIDTEIEIIKFDNYGNKHYSVFPTRTEAKIWQGNWPAGRIIPVLISPINKKRRRIS